LDMTVFHWPERVTVREVGLRDGLQSIARTLPTAQKLQWIQGAYDAGIREIEVGSFVPPKLLPQLADTAELVAFEGGRACHGQRRRLDAAAPVGQPRAQPGQFAQSAG
jgi:isopropylmalate/homocitrate/citramalate synthase